MFCTHCGNELKEGARFCSACGAPVDLADAASDALAQDADSIATELSPGEDAAREPQAGFAGQMESDRKRSRRKLSPLMIIALVLALLAGTALAAVLIVQQANQTEEPPAQAQSQETQPVSGESQSAESERALTAEERVIKSLDGWWQIGRAWKQNHYLYFHDGTVDVYSNEGEFQRTDQTIVPDDLVRADSGLGASRFGGPGYFIYRTDRNGYGFYLADDMPDNLHQVKSDGTGYSGGDSYARINPPSWAASIGEQSAEADAGSFDQAKAESEARAAAEAAGKTVLTGTVFVGKETDWAEKEGLPRAPNPDDPSIIAGLILDEPATVSARNADGATRNERPYVERSGTYVMFSGTETDSWTPYDGQRVTVAFSDFGSFSDSLGALFAFGGTGERIAPLSEADAAANVASGSSDGDFVLPDSSTRRYSRSELEKMDNHELFLARNEIFARHGCGFETPELRERFGSMSWYKETIPAGTYGTEMLNDVEKDNVELMKSIERERNSPYL